MSVIASDPSAGLPRLKPNFAKILEAILFVIELSEKDDCELTQFEIAKTVFLADYRHLTNYGRPVTFDNFTAMRWGPVPSLTYDMLKPSFNWRAHGMDGPPWRSETVAETKRHYSKPARPANLRKLSESDVGELREAFAMVKAMGFLKTSDFTHKLPAYKDAWDSRGQNKAKDMDLRRLLPDFDADMIADLQHASRFA